ncbi:MAG: hypothetical protein ACFFE4_06965 [Candidatus Thorarchaeota archaeon]
MESEKTEVIDFSGEKFNNFNMPCWVVIVVIPIIAIFDAILMIAFPESPYAIILSMVLILIFAFYYYSVASKSTGKLRKFVISEEEIEISLPHTPLFLVDWTEIKRIEITLKKLELKPYNVYKFNFIGENFEKKVSLSLYDFHKAKIEEIVYLMRKYSNYMKKEFSAVKETNVSGVYIVEDFF